jgi:Calcium-dependent channel, 7TM region, putative phosphate/Cytosolic domain of 10TM putative phosphate transporter
VLASLYLLSQEYNWYIKYRHKFLSLRIPRNFAVYVAGIPESLQSNYALTDFFQRSHWKSAVFEATVAMNIPKLEGKVAKREAVLQKLEHAMAEEHLKGKIKKHRTFQLKNAASDIKTVSQTVESVQEFRKQLNDLNKSISLEIGKVRNSNHRLRSNLAKQKFDSNILRGRALTPSSEELLEDHDIESGLEWSDTSANSAGDFLNGQYPSGPSIKSMMESKPIMTGEIPEEDSHVPDVEDGINVPEKMEDLEIRENAGELESPVWDESKNMHGNMSSTGSLSEIDDKSIDSESAKDFSFNVESVEQGEVSSDVAQAETSKPHPFLQLLGMGELDGIESSSRHLDDASLPTESKNLDPQESLTEVEEVADNPNPSEAESPEISATRGLSSTGEPAVQSRHDIMKECGHNSTIGTSLASFKSSSTNSIRSGKSDLSKRAGTSVRQLQSSLRQSIVNNVNVETVAGGVKKARDLGISGSKAVRDLGVKGSKKVGGGTLKAAKMSKKVAEYGLKKAHHELSENAAALAPMLRIAGEGAPRPAGFVTFKDRYTTQAALQMLQHPSSKSMLVEEAPTPSEVFWRNVGLPDKARRTGGLLSLLATVTLCLFWSFPVVFISSLTEVNSLKENLPRLGDMIEKSPALEMIFALMAPLLLLVLNEHVLPVILKWFAQWEGHISSPRLEASLFRKLSAFQMIQTFFVSTISGSLTSELANMIDNPESIVEFLANSLPAQSSYFIQLVLVFTFFFHGLELLRVTPLGYALIRRFVGPNLTAKESQKQWKFLYSLEDPPPFWHAETFSRIVLFYVVFFVYSTISPITSVFLLGCFVILESGKSAFFPNILSPVTLYLFSLIVALSFTIAIKGYRYLFIHNFPTSSDSGGRIWAGFVAMIFAGILIGQLMLIGLLLLNEAFYSVPALVPLVIITILFIIFVHPARMHVAQHLPAITCIELDRESSAENGMLEDFDFLRDQYLQPALKHSLVFPDESSFTLRSSTV